MRTRSGPGLRSRFERKPVKGAEGRSFSSITTCSFSRLYLSVRCRICSPFRGTAYVTLQENNALAVIDIASAKVTKLIGLGFKDHMLSHNGLEGSEKDGVTNITNRPVKGMYRPDEIAAYEYHGSTCLVMANEGDARDYPGLKEEVRVGKVSLDPTVFENAAELKKEKNLGRLNVSKINADTTHARDAVESALPRALPPRTPG